MKDIVTARAIELIAGVLELPPEKMDPDSKIAMLPGFDSLAYEQLVLAVEEELGRELEPLAMVSVETVYELGQLLDS